MNENDLREIKGKKAEAWIGLILLILPLFAVLSLFLLWFGIEDLLDWRWLSTFVKLRNLDYGLWSYGDGRQSPAPLFLSISAIAGAYLLKGSSKFLFVKTERKKEEQKAE